MQTATAARATRMRIVARVWRWFGIALLALMGISIGLIGLFFAFGGVMVLIGRLVYSRYDEPWLVGPFFLFVGLGLFYAAVEVLLALRSFPE